MATATMTRGVAANSPAGTDPALERLERVRDEALMDIELLRNDARELYIRQIEAADRHRAQWARVSRMAGLGDLPEFRSETKVVKAS